MPKTLALTALALAAAVIAVQPSASEAAHAGKHRPAMSASARRGLAFAQTRCSACHAVTENRSSPNPESPSFEDIANRPGVTAVTLHQFLRDSHNYPEAMNFTVRSTRLRDLADYIVTMKKPGYRPVM